MPNLAELLEDEEGEEAVEGGVGAGRRSDGAALMFERQSVGSGLAGSASAEGGSPPHKYQRKGGWGVGEGEGAC